MNNLKSQLLTPSLNSLTLEDKRQELKTYFNHTWETYESLFGLINHDDAYYLKPEPLRHPLIFYFGQTATFYINKLMLGKFIDKRINTKLEAICAVGVDEMSWDDLDATHYDWPSVNDVRDYRRQVSQLVNNLIDSMDIALPIAKNSLAWIILMGCEHERIHLETSSVIMRMLPLSFLTLNEQWKTCDSDVSVEANSLLPLTSQTVILGKPSTDDTFGWDNEYGHQTHHLNAFKASKYLVSNSEFMTFVKAGGYENKQYWTEEGENWLAYSKASMPRFWIVKKDIYYQRNLLNEIPLPLSWPAEVNYLEAKAFCHWKSELTGLHIHLPSEAQWHVLRGDTKQQAHIESANINLSKYASSCPVNRYAQGDFYDVSGNVWQWSESVIDGFDGFKVHPLYDDFSTPTFDGKHNIILGGSWISTGNEIIKSSRYAFRRHFTQHAGFRYVENISAEPPIETLNPYEMDDNVTQYLENHYAKPLVEFTGKPFYEALVDLIKESLEKLEIKTDKLLDLGCKVGRASFELSNVFSQIDAVDFSAAPIKHAVNLQQGKEVRYTQKSEGELISFTKVTPLPELLLSNDNLIFSQGDPSNLKPKYSNYNVVLAQNVLEESYDAQLFLTDIYHRINQDGLLIIVTDYHFEAKQPNSSTWIGGKKIKGENVTGFEGLSERLLKQYNLISQNDLIQVFSVDFRHYNLNKYHVTVWQKK